MKFIVLFVVVAACIALCLSAAVPTQLSEGSQGLFQNLDQLRIRKSAKSSYGAPAPSLAAPPCPTNYLLSCGPQLQPVACSSGGYQGAYSENIPQYTAPQYITPQHYVYPPYAVPVITEV